MEGLQRSGISFRRQGSSGLVWDDKLISGELNKDKDDGIESTDQNKPELRRTKSDGGGKQTYRTIKVQQVEDPPSPRVSGCGFCSVFGKPTDKVDNNKNNNKNNMNKNNKKSGKVKHK